MCSRFNQDNLCSNPVFIVYAEGKGIRYVCEDALKPYQLKVLIAEDDGFSQQLIAEMLKINHVSDIHFAGSGDEVLTKMADGLAPDLLICDLNMPGLDGIDLLKILGDRRFPGEIIVISGCDKRIIKAACKIAIHNHLNLTGGIEKPIDSKKLKRLVQYCCETRRTLRLVDEPQVITKLELLQAFEKKQFIAYFQPQVSVQKGSVEGVECLSRWRHPLRGVLLPGEFMPAIRRYQLDAVFIEYIFKAALKAFAVIHQECGVATLAINLSPEVLQDESLPQHLKALVEAEGLAIHQIKIQVCENEYVDDESLPIAILNHFCLKGFGLSIDDFGTGYSNLSRISQVPITEIKIDRRFVIEAHDDEVALSIIRNTVHLAKQLHVKTVAEGIENMSDWQLMRDLGCDLIQGYIVARPKELGQFKIWFSSWQKVMSKSEVSQGG